MSGFSSHWLDLREPLDHEARSDAVVSALCHYFLHSESLRIADIGGGTGSTLRALAPVMAQHQQWHIIDHDEKLLSRLEGTLPGVEVTGSLADLATSLKQVFNPVPDLVTTSAFLDLVSENWLRNLVDSLTIRNLPFYAALSVNGKLACKPEHPDDQAVIASFSAHQATDKGFGPALGPDGARTAILLFEKAGYTICESPSDWHADATHTAFQQKLLEGWHGAACETSPEHRTRFDQWLVTRQGQIDAGELAVLVGHTDFLAVPADQRAQN